MSPAGLTSRTRSSASSKPGVKVKITWYEKSALYAALKTALRAGQAPDVFYAEVDQTDYIDNNLLADLSTGVNWNNVEPWAKQAWTFGKGTYGFPLEASTASVYYNTKMMADLGVTVRRRQFTGGFRELGRRPRQGPHESRRRRRRPFPGLRHHEAASRARPKTTTRYEGQALVERTRVVES